MTEIALHEYVQKLEDLIEEGLYDEVLAHGRHILQHYPKHLATYNVLGKAMLEAREYRHAGDMFKRVLSGDPEDYLARVGMSIIYDNLDDLEKALWQMERAFELAPDNGTIRDELRRLYGRRDGAEPGRLDLTRGALARLYARGALYPRAVEELRSLLDEEPHRVDLRVALAEALWRNEQRVPAEEVCLQVLDELPFCLKANLILGEIYAHTGRAEGQEYLERAEMLDPENRRAVELLGDEAPLSPRVVHISELEYTPTEERPEWMPAVEMPASEAEEAALMDMSAALETQIEIPAWLEEVALGDETDTEPEETEGPPEEEIEEPLEVPEWMETSTAEEPAVEAEMSAPSFEEEEAPAAEAAPEVPEWLSEVGIEEELEPAEPDEVPDWTSEVDFAEEDEEFEAPTPAEELEATELEEMPDWLADLSPEEGAEIAPPAAEEMPEAAEIPDWLAEMAPSEEAIPESADLPDWLADVEPGESLEDVIPEDAEDIPDWLADLSLSTEEEVPPSPAGEAPEPAEIPDWLTDMAPEGAGNEAPSALDAALPEEAAAPEQEVEIPDWLADTGPAEASPTPEAEEEPAAESESGPSWLEGDEMPSGDDALAWLESLTAGKEDQLRAAAEMEADARVAEITGRRPAKPEPEEPEVAAPPPQAAAPEQEVEIPDWLADTGPAEAPPTPEAEEEPAAESEAGPSWLEGDEMPSGDDALAWLESLTAGKEDELRAAAEMEADARVAEITGRRPAKPEPEPEEPEVAAPPPQAAAPEQEVEIPDWLADTAPAEAPPPPEAEEEPAAEPEAGPSWLEGDEMPSGDDALAWLESLAAGKEDELRAAAEMEADARVAEITGRRPAKPEPEEPDVTAPPPQAAAPEAPDEEVSLPDWLSETTPAPEEEPEEPPSWLESFGLEPSQAEEAPEAEGSLQLEEEPTPPPEPEAFGWTSMGDEEIPEAPVPLEEERTTIEGPMPPAESEAFGWTALGEKEVPGEPVEAIPRLEEPVEGFGWTGFGAEPEAEEAPIAEAEPEMAAPVEAEEAPIVEAEPEMAAPVEAEEAPIVEAEPEEPTPPPPAPAEVEALRERVQADEDDAEARLALARGLWQAGIYNESLAHYAELLESNKLVEEVLEDMEAQRKRRPADPLFLRILGDAYVRTDQLEEALQVYQEALSAL